MPLKHGFSSEQISLVFSGGIFLRRGGGPAVSTDCDSGSTGDGALGPAKEAELLER